VTAIESQSATAVEWWARILKAKPMVETQAVETKTANNKKA
jgi:hypothetical protein